MKKKKEWCKHLAYWGDKVSYGYFYNFRQDYLRKDLWVPRNWKVCPICGKRRPK